ncbi:unnamed protein product [Prunus armeniaca]|uniref:Uncharacterized protein n=1 Tax=Prunus armeniaca TaxID=36596 RepID=A0A6J5UKL1_PRUAR|nr:unnamed protein product [Prunus armeniaca]
MAVMIKISSMVVQSQSMNLTHYLKETAWEEPEENLSKLLSQPSEDFSQACEKMFKGCKEFFQYIHQENSLVPTTPPTVEKIENLEEVKNEDQKMVQEQKYEEIPTKEDSQVNFYKDQNMVRVEIDMVVGNKTNLPKSSMAKLELEAKSGFSIHFLWELDPANRDSSWHQQFDRQLQHEGMLSTSRDVYSFEITATAHSTQLRDISRAPQLIHKASAKIDEV